MIKLYRNIVNYLKHHERLRSASKPMGILLFMLLLSASFYSIAHTHPKPVETTSIKTSLNKPNHANTQQPLLALNTALTSTGEQQNNSPIIKKTALLQTAAAMPVLDEFPEQLPGTLEDLSTQKDGVNTPEYVIIRSSEQTTFSSETSAEVASINIKEGSDFNEGDILLKLDCREQNAELDKAKAQQLAMNTAQKSAEKLKSYGAISEFELIKAQTDAQMANAEVAKLIAVTDKCTIKAPFTGSVAELMVHAHESVKPGDPLLKIVSTENIELQMQIPSSWLQWIHIGSEFTVHVSEINKTIDAKITKINPQIDSVSQTVKIIGTITEKDPKLRPGMSGQALFTENPDRQSTQDTK